MEYYLAIKSTEVLVYATMWMNLQKHYTKVREIRH